MGHRGAYGSAYRKSRVISVDTKKVELIGNFKQAGAEWRKSRRRVNLYDFPTTADGKAIPYGIYDLGRNHGYVVVGTSHDTPAFAVAAIRQWWLAVGQSAYDDQSHLLIECEAAVMARAAACGKLGCKHWPTSSA
jgi:hypothetical protein